MSVIKIISNPYQKKVTFQRMEDNGEWVAIDYKNNPNSKLLQKELTGGFFPFYVKKIVDYIIDEYSIPGEPIELLFEGSKDEYLELEAVCKDEPEDRKVSIKRTNIYLENARDILPEVKRLFREMSPLIMQSVNQEYIQHDMNRFEDASSDVVPICVLGNYSAGKSTFINALIGSEILPSGSEPVTAKIYKIARSKYSDRARISFKYLGEEANLVFTPEDSKIEFSAADQSMADELRAAADEINDAEISVRVNKALTIINEYEDREEGEQLSDLIEVEVPFANGVLANSQHPFVIFDTPGSNSATNTRHLPVLKQAMENMTNGLPIFLCTSDSLDSTDNETLYKIIHSFEELDDRFTMIIVNKADNAGIQRRDCTAKEESRVLNQAVPRNLYSGGLFYVSSILGLGSKTNGKFEDYVYEDIYDAQEERYNDPENKHYRMLYKFNIMPLQIKHRSDEQAAQQTELIYANSGLYSVETEIENFAGKYAAYNKCLQSQQYLNSVITITESEIEEQKQRREEYRHNIREKLEIDKQKLIDLLEEKASEESIKSDEGYSQYMAEYLEMTERTFSSDELKKQNAVFIAAQENEKDYGSREQEVQEAREAVTENLKTNIGEIFKDKKINLTAIRETAEGFSADISTIVDRARKQIQTRHDVDRAAADDLLNYVTNYFEEKLIEFHKLLDEKSREYWTNNTEEIRKLLAKEVSGSEVLTDDRREELERIIITYEQVVFSENNAVNLFKKVDFERKLQVGNIVIWESDHLDTVKLASFYNTNMQENIHQGYELFEKSHRESAHEWIQSLLDEINTNIVKYSPELSKQAKAISDLTHEIAMLEERQNKLRDYTDELDSMISWKIG